MYSKRMSFLERTRSKTANEQLTHTETSTETQDIKPAIKKRTRKTTIKRTNVLHNHNFPVLVRKIDKIAKVLKRTP